MRLHFPKLSKKQLWDGIPGPLRAVLGRGLGALPLPLILGAEFRRVARFVQQAELWDEERIREFELVRLQQVVSHAFAKSSYYRKSFGAISFAPGDLRSLEDFQRLPTIDKAVVREHAREMLTRPDSDSGVELVTTGGTSGVPLRFYTDSSRHSPEFAHLTSCWARAGYRLGDPLAVFRGRLIPRRVQGMHYEYDPLFRFHYYSTFHMASTDLESYLSHLHQVQPAFIHAYPSSIFALARFALARGLKFPGSMRGVLVESEAVFPHQRDLIERQLGLPLFPVYGHSEKLIMAAPCSASPHYHVLPTYGFCEVLNEADHPVLPGESGELTGTGFINQTMPLIRYRTDDFTSVIGTGCPHCGRPHRLLGAIQPKRTQEYLVARDGVTLVSVLTLTGPMLHDDTLQGVRRFQFVQEQPGRAVLHLVRSAEEVAPSAAEIAARFSAQIGHAVDLDVRFVEEIPLTGVGKQPMILQRCPGFDRLLAGVVVRQ